MARMSSRLIGSDGPRSSSVGLPARKSTTGHDGTRPGPAALAGTAAGADRPGAGDHDDQEAYIAYLDQSQPIRTR